MSLENSTTDASYTNYDVNIEEICAFIGLVFLYDISKSGRENVRSLWSTKMTGEPILRTVMNLNRFLFLLLYIFYCFDDLSTRYYSTRE